MRADVPAGHSCVDVPEPTQTLLLDELLSAVRAAYITGYEAPAPPPGPADDRADFDPLWAEDPEIFGLGELPREQKLIFQRAKYHCTRARASARELEASLAWSELAMAEKAFSGLVAGSKLWLLVRSEVLSAEAAVEYLARNYEQSERQLLAARRVDRDVYETFGKKGSLAHGFHLASKQAQLETARGRYGAAMEIAAAGLSILSNRTPDRPSLLWPLQQTWPLLCPRR